MVHRVSCVRRDGNLGTYDIVTIDYDKNECSGKEGCIANCKFTVVSKVSKEEEN